MLEPKELELTDSSGKTRVFFISKFPAIAGREIVTKYPLSNIPKIGEYQQSEDIMIKLMSFVEVQVGDHRHALSTKALIDSHVGDWETLAKVEWAMLEYNCSFFPGGLNSGFFGSFSKTAGEWISRTLIPLLAQSLQAAKPPSGNSKPN